MLVKDHKDERVKAIKDRLLRWSSKRTGKSILNMLSIPYGDVEIFVDLIVMFIKNKKRVLYITNEDESDISILKAVRKSGITNGYTYFRNKGSIDHDIKLVLSNHDNAWDINMNFDLVIYDDISSYSNYSKIEIEELIISKKAPKSIVFSIEEVFLNGESIEYYIMDYPFSEPRFVNTRIDINKDIPYMIYEYIDFFIKSKRNLVIYLPDEQRRNIIEQYLCEIDESYKELLIDFEKEPKRAVKMMRNKDTAAINITNSMYNIPKDVNNIDIIVYFADDIMMTYKKFIFLCGESTIINGASSGEVIFLSNSVSEAMDKAKDLSRSFNKAAWENGYLGL